MSARKSVAVVATSQGHIAPFDSTRFLLNFLRFILPFPDPPVTTFGGFPESGTSDITFSLFFFRPRNEAHRGRGSGVRHPDVERSAPDFGQVQRRADRRRAAAGRSLDVGALVNQLWSYGSVASDFTRAVNQMFFQPLVAYQMKHAVTLTVDSESTLDWEASSGQRSTVPIIGLISKVTRLDRFRFRFREAPVITSGDPTEPSTGWCA